MCIWIYLRQYEYQVENELSIGLAVILYFSEHLRRKDGSIIA